MNDLFRRFAQRIAVMTGSGPAFVFATLMVGVWALSGPIFNYSDTWQLVINTATTVLTFLIVFLIQNTQNRDAKALHLKLDELLAAIGSARTDLVDLEDRGDEELKRLKGEFDQRAKSARAGVEPAPQDRAGGGSPDKDDGTSAANRSAE